MSDPKRLESPSDASVTRSGGNDRREALQWRLEPPVGEGAVLCLTPTPLPIDCRTIAWLAGVI